MTLVEHPGGGWAARKSCPHTPDNLRRMSLELHLLDGARKDRVPNVLWALSTHVDNSQGVLSFDMEWADRLTLEEYIHNHPNNYISPELVQWVGLQAARGLGWVHGRHILHGDLKTTNLFVFSGAQEPVVKIGDLGSSLCLDAFGVDSASHIQRCTTTYEYAAPEMLLAGIRKLPHIGVAADIYSLGVILLELCGTQHPLHPFVRRGMQEMHDLRPAQLLPYNPRWTIPDDLQEVIDLFLAYDPTKRPSAQTLTLHKGLATGREFVLQHLVTPTEHEAALQEIERLRALLNPSMEGESSSTATNSTIKVKTHPTPHSYCQSTSSTLSHSKDMHIDRTSPLCKRSPRSKCLSPQSRRLGISQRSRRRRSSRPTTPAFHRR